MRFFLYSRQTETGGKVRYIPKNEDCFAAGVPRNDKDKIRIIFPIMIRYKRNILIKTLPIKRLPQMAKIARSRN